MNDAAATAESINAPPGSAGLFVLRLELGLTQSRHSQYKQMLRCFEECSDVLKYEQPCIKTDIAAAISNRTHGNTSDFEQRQSGKRNSVSLLGRRFKTLARLNILIGSGACQPGFHQVVMRL